MYEQNGTIALAERRLDVPDFGQTAPRKRCSHCAQEKPRATDFHRNRIMHDGYMPICKLCFSEIQLRGGAAAIKKRLERAGRAKPAPIGQRGIRVVAGVGEVRERERAQEKTPPPQQPHPAPQPAPSAPLPPAAVVAPQVTPHASSARHVVQGEVLSLADYLTLAQVPSVWVSDALAVLLTGTSDAPEVRILTADGDGPTFAIPLSGVEYVCRLIAKASGATLDGRMMY